MARLDDAGRGIDPGSRLVADPCGGWIPSHGGSRRLGTTVTRTPPRFRCSQFGQRTDESGHQLRRCIGGRLGCIRGDSTGDHPHVDRADVGTRAPSDRECVRCIRRYDGHLLRPGHPIADGIRRDVDDSDWSTSNSTVTRRCGCRSTSHGRHSSCAPAIWSRIRCFVRTDDRTIS